MSSLPAPPANLHDRQLPLYTLRRRPGALLRLAWKDPGSHLAFRASARFRFDSTDGSFGVTYAAFDLETSFVETILRDKPASPTGPTVMLDYVELRDRRVINLDTAGADRALHLVKLYDEGLAAVGTDNRLSSVNDYAATQRWAKVLHDHPRAPDGLIYMSRYLGARRSVVLFDRARDQVTVGSVTPLLSHPELPKLLDRYRVGIDRP